MKRTDTKIKFFEPDGSSCRVYPVDNPSAGRDISKATRKWVRFTGGSNTARKQRFPQRISSIAEYLIQVIPNLLFSLGRSSGYSPSIQVLWELRIDKS
jgi:hypothetical protein